MSYKVLLAPTKNIHSIPFRNQIVTVPHFMSEAKSLIDNLKTKSIEELSSLMGISHDMALLNSIRYKQWKKSSDEPTAYHAIQMYAGEAFKAFDFDTIDARLHVKLQQNLFILSGLYGILRPFDLIYPYRLEMGLRFSPSTNFNNLYSFWEEKLGTYFEKLVSKEDVLINLASKEYTKVFDFNKLKYRVITPHFKEYKDGNYQMVMMYAKNARGTMARYVIENNIQSDDDLKRYKLDGYVFNSELSSDMEWFFIR